MLPIARQWLAAGFAAVHLLQTADAAPVADDWFKLVWQADNGLPGDNVTGVAQTRDGYLWITTQSGLARFDGVRIQSVPMPVGRTHPIIRAMLLDHAERLWLAQERGVLLCHAPGQTTLFTATNGLSTAQPLELAQSGDHSVWIAYADGSVCCVLDGQVTRHAETNGLTGSGVCSVTTDVQGRLWFAKGGQIGHFRGGQFVGLYTLSERSIRLQGARNGDVWVCAGDRLLKCGAAEAPRALGRLPSDSPLVRATALLEDTAGALWIGTAADGLFRYDGTNFAAIETSHGRIQSLLQDREGNIWVGTDGGGLNRLRQQVVELQGREAGLPFDTVRSVCEDTHGALWVITQDGAVAKRGDGGWQTVSAGADWPGGQATCVACDREGTVWIGTYSRGLYRWKEGSFGVVRRTDGLASSSIRSLLPDRRGNLWIAFSAGDTLQRFCDGQFQDYRLPPGGRAIRAMTEDAAGTIWMANLDAQLLRVVGEVVVDETPRSPGQFRPIRCLAGATDGSLWIGYSTIGVGRLKNGQFVRVGTEQGLQDAAVCSLVVGRHGWMWCGSEHGIFRVSLQGLTDVVEARAAGVTSVSFGRDDGLPSLQASYGYSPGSALTRAGRVLIPTHSGLAIVHPERVYENRLPPHTIIEEVLVDGAEVPPALRAPALTLPPRHHKLEVVFTAPSFIEPEKVRFRYQLKGWDETVVEAGPERRAVYSRLPAGRYEFSVRACNNAGLWNEAPAAFHFQVTPFFWQTWWFRTAIAVLFATVVFAIARYVSVHRLEKKVRRLEAENALQKERARIAKDIHDDLGAHMTQISLLSELTERALPEPQKATELVQQIAAMSRKGIKSLDEIVWAVNPRNDTLQDLLDYAGQYAADFLRLAGIRCRVDFPESPLPQEIPADVRHSLFLAVKEALNNVVKHAQATEVWLRVGVTESALQWVVEDNGRGFVGASDEAWADGLRNMQQRLGELGGTCSREARPGGGTRICFALPWRRG